MGKGTTDKDLEWEKRMLCSDGNCIGVIGADRRCKECGMAYDGDLPVGEEGESEEEPVSASEEDEAVASAEHGQAAPEEIEDIISDEASEDTDSEWENRRLCSDGNCIGVIGADGRCKECGKPSEA